MILIADSGSTKTDWAIIDKENKIQEFKSEGLNPYFVSETKIAEIINETFANFDNQDSISKIHFYGAGCNSEEKESMIINALKLTFKSAEIKVSSDILGAARSLFKENRGIAVILGTGSNSCRCDDSEIKKNISSFGYILGDEGSGSNIGKTFITAFLNNEISNQIRTNFKKEFNLTVNEILENVYRKPNPNKFLASFTEFVSQNIEDETMQMIVSGCFYDLFARKLTKYNLNKDKVGFIGSVAYHFKDLLEEVAEEFEADIIKIEKSPMKGLIEYHSKKQ